MQRTVQVIYPNTLLELKMMKGVIALLATATLCAAQSSTSTAAKPGDPCSVPFPQTCGESTLVDEVIAKSDKYG